MNERSAREHTSLATVASIAVIAYAAADVVHEFVGHAVVAALAGVDVLSISSVAVQTVQSSRLVAAAGTIADLLAGLAAFGWLAAGTARFDSGRYACWLFAFVAVMNGGYLAVSGLSGTGDWAVVIAGEEPAWLWRVGLIAAGTGLYIAAVRLAASAASRWTTAGLVSVDALRRVTRTSYIAGGCLPGGRRSLQSDWCSADPDVRRGRLVRADVGAAADPGGRVPGSHGRSWPCAGTPVGRLVDRCGSRGGGPVRESSGTWPRHLRSTAIAGHPTLGTEGAAFSRAGLESWALPVVPDMERRISPTLMRGTGSVPNY